MLWMLNESWKPLLLDRASLRLLTTLRRFGCWRPCVTSAADDRASLRLLTTVSHFGCWRPCVTSSANDRTWLQLMSVHQLTTVRHYSCWWPSVMMAAKDRTSLQLLMTERHYHRWQRSFHAGWPQWRFRWRCCHKNTLINSIMKSPGLKTVHTEDGAG